MDVARLNTSHGRLEEHAATAATVRRAADLEGRPVGVLMDLGGPKLRVGAIEGDAPVNLVHGARLVLTDAPIAGTSDRLSVGYPRLREDIAPGETVLLDDGRIELRVDSVEADGLHCTVVFGGLLSANKGVAFPQSTLTLPALTDRDRAAIETGVAANVDYFALSFIRQASDIDDARGAIGAAGADIPIVAKIEKRQAITNLDEIVAASDGVMVARGDLGVELPPEEVPIQQRRIIAAAARYKVPVITATQMLESMVATPRPSRAEASDVANATWELSDALMLSAETAVGRYPVQAVAMMDRIIRRAEASAPAGNNMAAPINSDDHSYVIALAARQVVDSDPNLRAIVCFTNSGYSAFLMSKAHPTVPIYAVSPQEPVVRRLTLARGVTPVLAPPVATVEDMFHVVDETLLKLGLLAHGEEVLIAGSLPVRAAGTTNFIKLHAVGEALDRE